MRAVADPNVEVLRVVSPRRHNFHAEQASLCMRAGKGVLVEKASARHAAGA